MKKVLVTGASGFIGYHCIEPLCQAGYEIHAISSKAQSQEQAEVVWHQVDLLDLTQILKLITGIKPTHLLHLAWNLEPNYANSPANILWAQTSLELVRQFAEHGGKRVVIAGSSYEYDWNYGYCLETITPKIPNTLYGACKNALSQIIAEYSLRNNLSNAWGTIFFIYGPREHPSRLVSSVILSLLRGEPALSSHGRQIRDYLYVQDVADALVALLDSEVEGRVNIASGQPVALKEIIEMIGAKLQKTDLIRLGALPAKANDVPLVVANVHRLTSEVGWQQKYDLDKGLTQTIEWWEANK